MNGCIKRRLDCRPSPTCLVALVTRDDHGSRQSKINLVGRTHLMGDGHDLLKARHTIRSGLSPLSSSAPC